MPLLCRRAGARGRPMLSQGSWRGCEASLPWLNRPSGGLFAASGRWAWDAGGKQGRWCARRDSNPRPMASEATTLSG